MQFPTTPVNTTLADMAVLLEQFVRELEDSGILASETLREFLPPKATPQSADELIEELIRQKCLTKYQAEQINRGHARSLILGNYLLLEKIGMGGRGTVFKARHRPMDRLVALKVLSETTRDNPMILARFEREIKAAAKLHHPNIVTALDADFSSDRHYLVMELVEGRDLSHLVKRNGLFSVADAVQVILQAAKGLEAAHQAGIIHRDIKPGNILLAPSGLVKILDLGLARVDLPGHESTTQTELTSTGAVMGTVDYMSPEQALNTKNADARSDIYSLGCTLFYLLAGKIMYPGDTVIEKILAHREQPIPTLREINPDVPPELETIYLRMVAKKPEQRFASMTELIAALQALRLSPVEKRDPATQNEITSNTSGHSKTEIQSPRHSVSGKAVLWIAGGLVVVVLAVVAYFSTQPLEKDFSGAISKKLQPEIENTPATNFPTSPTKPLAYLTPEFQQWEQETLKLSGLAQVDAVKAKLVELNPDFNGETTHRLEGDVVTFFDIWTNHVRDISPVRVFRGLKNLYCSATGPSEQSPLEDLSPIQGMSLLFLACNYTRVADLTPLRGMKLDTLTCDGAPIRDFSVLGELPLINLNLPRTPISDLKPLENLKLVTLSLEGTPVTDLRPLQGMPLTTLTLTGTKVSDLSPIKDLPLRDFCADFVPERDYPLLRNMTKLEHINRKPVVEFWGDQKALGSK